MLVRVAGESAKARQQPSDLQYELERAAHIRHLVGEFRLADGLVLLGGGLSWHLISAGSRGRGRRRPRR